MVDFPDRAAQSAWRFLSKDECEFMLRRIKNDRDDGVAEPFNIRKWAATGLDLKVWGFALIFFTISTIVYAIAYFLPIILRDNVSLVIDLTISSQSLTQLYRWGSPWEQLNAWSRHHTALQLY